jgi:hypothetical protein
LGSSKVFWATIAGYDITVISPEELSYKMLDLYVAAVCDFFVLFRLSQLFTCLVLRTKTNLNEISHNAAIDLIKAAISKGVNITEVQDCHLVFCFFSFA